MILLFVQPEAPLPNGKVLDRRALLRSPPEPI